MNVPMTTAYGWWDKNAPRYTHWEVTTLPENPYRNMAAPIIAATVQEMHLNFDVDPKLLVTEIFSAISLAASALIDVVHASGQCGPTVLFTIGVDDKAKGKSTIHDAINKGLRELQSACLAAGEFDTEKNAQDLIVWGVTLRALQQAMSKKVKSGEDASAEVEALREHLDRRPKSPRRGPYLFDDATCAAFYYGAYRNGVSVRLGGPEGGTLFFGDALNEPQKLNAFFSGEDVRIDRKTGPSYTISGVRVTVGILVQPDVLKDFIQSKRGKKAAGTGFNSRLLVCDSTSYKKQPNGLNAHKTWEATERLRARLVELMKRTLMTSHIDGFQRQELRFTTEAVVRLTEVRSRIENCREAGGMYEFAQDHAGRLPEIIARLSALMHFFEGKEGDIGIETLEAAILIAYLSSIDYLKLFVPPPREYTDAITLDEWFDKYRSQGQFLLDKSYARNFCPNSVRRDHYDFALLVLLKQGKVCWGHDIEGYPCLQIIPPQQFPPQQYAYGRVKNGQRVVL